IKFDKKAITVGNYWEYTTFQIRYVAIKRGKELSKEKRQKQDRRLKEIISNYEKDEQTQNDANMLIELQSELDKIYQNLARGAYTFQTKMFRI
ncbi:MAG: hypothetical protein ACRC0V_07245, partial [Fusobacteriaceae bacterium]